VSIFQNTLKEENWYITTSGTYTSAQEQKALFEPGESRFAGLPFDQSYFAYEDISGGLQGQLALINSSTTAAYNFSSLSIYTDLDTSFFNSSDFDSTAAIASGHLALDAVAAMGVGAVQIPLNGLQSLPEPSQTFPILDFPLGSVEPDTYVLVTGTASPILSDGSFGPGTTFSFAIAPIPEPSSLMLLCSVSVLIGLLSYFRQRRAQNLRRVKLPEG
jgi:hypothetical protein